jgi:hypothetical protein
MHQKHDSLNSRSISLHLIEPEFEHVKETLFDAKARRVIGKATGIPKHRVSKALKQAPLLV